MSEPCYFDRFREHPCQKSAVWRSAHLGNMVDGWTWCAEHAPDPRYRVPVDYHGQPLSEASGAAPSAAKAENA
jgi:hypothetical protein